MVYLFLADGFEECEALAPLDILRRGGITVKTVGISNQFVTGAHRITVKADIPEKDIILNEESKGKVSAKAGNGPYTMTDLGIVKCHFELGAGKENFEWADKE